MLTQCQQCKSIFQVSDAQLAVANGYVRCGRCLAIFSAAESELKDLPEEEAFKHFHYLQKNGPVDEKPLQQRDWVDDQPLFDNETSPDDHAQTTAPLPEGPQTPFHEITPEFIGNESLANDPDPDPEIVTEPIAEEEIIDTFPGDSGPEQILQDDSKHSLEAINENEHEAIIEEDFPTPITESLNPAAEMTATGYRIETGGADNNAEDQEFTPEKEIPAFILEQIQAEQVAYQRRSTIFWLLGSLLLTLAFTLQLIYFSRDQLAHDPQFRPWLAKACELAGCDLALPYDIERIKIIKLEIFSHPQRPEALLANTAIINQADFTQPYPLLLLTFSDISGTLRAQRRFLPEEYLPADIRLETGMKPDTPINLVLQLADPGEDAINFEFHVQSDPRHQLSKPKLKNPLIDLLSRL